MIYSSVLTGNSLLNCKELTLSVICVKISWGKKSVQRAFIEMLKELQCPFMVTISPQCQSISRLYIMEIKTHINTHINVKMLRAVITHTFIFNCVLSVLLSVFCFIYKLWFCCAKATISKQFLYPDDGDDYVNRYIG